MKKKELEKLPLKIKKICKDRNDCIHGCSGGNRLYAGKGGKGSAHLVRSGAYRIFPVASYAV